MSMQIIAVVVRNSRNMQLNCLFIAAVLEEGLADPAHYAATGGRSKWAKNIGEKAMILSVYKSAPSP